MPKWLHNKLSREAKGLTGKHKDAYVYGTLNKLGKSKLTDAINRKHERKIG